MSRAPGESEQRLQEVSALLETARALLEHREFRDAARPIFDSCKKLIKATAGYVAMKSEDGTENDLLFLDSGGRTCTVDPSLSMPIRGMREGVLRSGRVEFDNDFAKSDWVKFLPAGHAPLDNVLFAPLLLDGEAVGLLGLANKPGGFTANDAHLAAGFADLAAVALRNSRLLESLRQAHAESEAKVRERTAELVAANETLQVRVEHHRCLVDAIGTSNIGLLIVDANHRVRFMNQPMIEAFGDHTGRTCYECLGEASSPCSHCKLEEVIQQRMTVHYQPRTAVGRIFDVVAVPFRDSDGTRCKLEILQEITERTRAQDALNQSQTRTRLLADVLERSAQPFGIGYPDGRLGFCNPAFCKLTGYSERELRSMNWSLELTPEEWREPEAQALALLEETGNPVRYEKEYVRKDGSRVPIELLVHRITGGLGAVECYYAFVTDITERKQSEGALRTSEERYRTVADFTYDWEYWLQPDGTYLYVSPACERITGYAAEQFRQDPGLLLAVTHPDDRKALADHLQQAVAGSDPSGGIDFRVTTRSGEERWIGHMCVPVFGSDGVFLGRRGSNRDITENKRAQVALLQSERRLREFYESGLVGVIYWNMNGRITDANDKFLEMVGYTRDELAADQVDWLNMTPPEFRYLDDRSVAELKATGVNRTPFEKEYIRKDGTRVPIVLAGAMLDEERTNGVAFVLDITERKRAEAERQALEQQLRGTQKMEAIGSLAGGIAHDFNNLLSVILSYTGFALESVREGDPLRDDLREVEKAGERAAALTRQLLAFSRKQVLEPVPLVLNRIVADLEKMLRRILGEDIELVQVLPPDLGLTLADPGQIEQVIMNLVVNARDAMPTGGKLTIETSNFEVDEEYATLHVGAEPGPYVQLAVTDTGCGMDERTRSRIFEPFFTTKEKGKGTGLGLSTVYGIVKQSGGSVWVHSELGHGTTFKVLLPRALSATAQEPRAPVAATRLVGTETILVVEDEEAIRNLAKRILEGAGYKVLTAANGGEALLTCEAHQGEIHLLVTDVVMPQMSGRTLSQRLAVVRPKIKVLFMSGYTDNAIVHHGVLDPGTRFMSKPFTQTGLLKKTREVLDEDFPGGQSRPASGAGR